ncbi:hypothetical protein FBU30_004804 [Linnemannia zychae]|nr:hypothetical protein FBU30_004804 [Linnemannia zychae]
MVDSSSAGIDRRLDSTVAGLSILSNRRSPSNGGLTEGGTREGRESNTHGANNNNHGGNVSIHSNSSSGSSSSGSEDNSISPGDQRQRLVVSCELQESSDSSQQTIAQASGGMIATIPTDSGINSPDAARIGGDLIICMVFSGLWFLSGVGLVIDTVWVDCGRLVGLESVIEENHRSVNTIRRVCQLEKATLGLAVISWACWMGVLLVLLYGHFWKRRQVIAERLRDRLSRRRPSTTTAAGTSSAVAAHPSSVDLGVGTGIGGTTTTSSGGSPSVMSGRAVGGNSSGGNHNNISSDRRQSSSGTEQKKLDTMREFNCQDQEGEVGLTGIVCRYEDEENGSILGQGSRRSRS